MTFTAKTTWGPVDVLIIKPVSVLGVDGFAVHRKLKRHRAVPYSLVISHIGTGYKLVPTAPARTVAAAVNNCLDELAQRGIDRAQIERRILELSSLDKEA